MFKQHEYIREAVAMDLNETYRQDLPNAGLLSSMLIRISGAQASGLGQTGGSWRILDYLSKLEVILNGATVCKSLTPKQVQAGSVWDQGVMPPEVWRNYATNTQYTYLLLNFGRFMGDDLLGLDLARYDNVEFKLTNTALAAQFSDLTISMLGLYLRDMPAGAFRGYVRSEEWRRWNTVADETKYLELPTDFNIRRIMLEATPDVDADGVEDTGIANQMEDIELNFDTGQTKVYKGGIDDLIRLNYYWNGRPLIATGSHYMNADKGVDVSLGYVRGGAWGAGSQDGAGAIVIPTMETGRTSFTQKPETYEADSPQGFIFEGAAPYQSALFNFDDVPDPAQWLNPQQRATVQLNIKTRNSAASADGVNAVVLDRYVP